MNNFINLPSSSSSSSLLNGNPNRDSSLHGDILEDRELFEDDPEIILSLVWYGNMLGAASYNVDTGQLEIMSDCSMAAPDFHLLHQLVKQIAPASIIASSRTDERILNELKCLKSSTDGGVDETPETNAMPFCDRFLQLLPSLDFAYESCKYRILHIELPSMPVGFTETSKRIYMMGRIDFTNTCMIKAMGALLKYIEKRRIGVTLEDSFTKPSVKSISLFSLKNAVMIDENTFSALQIFMSEKHPSVYKHMAQREGLSLYSVCNRCKSATGVRKFRQWFQQPSNDIDVLLKRQATVKFFSANDNIEIVKEVQSCLKQIKPIHKILWRMRTAQATLNDWKTLYKTCYNASVLGNMCCSLPSNIELFCLISTYFTPEILEIASQIHKIMDFDQSTFKSRFVVNPGINEDLDTKKRTYNGLPDFMTQVAEKELQNLTEDIQECSVIYLPQLGYLLTIPETPLMKATNHVLQNLEFVFVSNNTAHYKSDSTKELDESFGDTLCDITDIETEIMHELQNHILIKSNVLLDVMKYSSELDCLVSLATIAREFNFVQPQITDGFLEIVNGRNLLQELCVDTFVPNNTLSDPTRGKVCIITGPNGSGKSVYLKQVALIVFLTHIGSFVPAEKAKIPLVDKIFTRIHTVESVSLNMSAFFIDLKQMSHALKYATEKSLVIIDEFGNGTESTCGMSLLAAALKSWMKNAATCPHLLISTHFHEIFNLLPECPILKYMTMEILRNGEELVCLYKLIDGRASWSFAANILIQANIPGTVLERVKEITQLRKQNMPIPARNPAVNEAVYEKYSSVFNEFLQMNLEENNVRSFLQRTLGITDHQSPSTTATTSTTSTGRTTSTKETT